MDEIKSHKKRKRPFNWDDIYQSSSEDERQIIKKRVSKKNGYILIKIFVSRIIVYCFIIIYMIIHASIVTGGKLQCKCNIPKLERGRGGVECKF